MRKTAQKMKAVDTREVTRYSPLVPAMAAICTSARGEEVKIIMNDASAFNDAKEYLAEQGIGFREIYDGETMILQFMR